MPVREFGYWVAFYQMEPTTESANHRTALVCATVANASGNYKRSFSPKDFMPPKRRRAQTMQEQISVLKRFEV